MRIDRLDLIAYGPFSRNVLDLSAGDSGLHLIYGDNEAGKSTSLRALIAWLFGIPARTPDSFLHANAQLRIGGKLRLSDGNELEFVRRKGTKGTLLAFDTEETLDDSILLPFLPGGIDETLFTKLYGIDYNRLIEGGKELLNQSGDLGQALFSAVAGISNLRGILDELKNSADKLFSSRASQKVVNQATADYKTAQKQIKEASLPVAEWKRLQKELAETLAAIAQIEERIDTKNKEKSRLERLKRVHATLAERRAVLSHMKEMEGVLLLSEDFDEKRKAAIDKLEKAVEAKKKAEARRSRLRDEAASLNIRQELLNKEEEILSMHKDLGAVEKAINDQPLQDGKRRQLRNEAEIFLKTVRPDLSLEQADKLRPLLVNKKWIAGLAQHYSLLNQKKEDTKTDLKDAEDEQISIRKKLGELSQSNLDISELKATIAAARKPGDIEQRLADMKKSAADQNASCENELARLGRYSGTLASFFQLALPVPETLDAFEKRFEEISQSSRDIERENKELEEQKKQSEQELMALLLRSDVPNIAELEESRKERDLGWGLVKRKYIENIDVETEIMKFAPDSELSVIYEQKVEAADHISDRLRLDADQVVKRADLEAKKGDIEARLKGLTERSAKVNAVETVLRKEWQAVWEPLGIDPGTPREMKQWLPRVDNLRSNIQSAHAIAGEAQKIQEECKNLKNAVASQISRFDQSLDLSGMSLETLINLCEQRVEQEEATLEQKRLLKQSLTDAEIRKKRADEDLKSIRNDLANWKQEWGQAIEGLGLDADVHPKRVTEIFEQLEAFFDAFDKSEELRKRIYGMEQVAEKFKEKVSAFVEGIGIKIDGREATLIAAQLHRELSQAREARASLKKIEAQDKEIAAEIEDAEIAIRTAEDQLAALREQAGIKTNDELESVAERSKHKRETRQSLDRLEQELIRNGDGLSLEDLEKEAVESDIDTIDGERERVTLELKTLQEERDDLRDRRQTLQNEITAKDGSSTAANASEEAAQQLAIIVSHGEQYLRLRIASLILEQQIESYRKKNQTPVLARAGKLFSRLTMGSYVNLRDELDGNSKPVLLGVRPDDKEVPVEGMSDGSRDQLFLALRLATLEQHLSQGEPLPFVVDDILIGFDDNRTRACLEVLAELAVTTQVLLFTHHRRVLELTDGIQAEAGVYIHELSTNE